MSPARFPARFNDTAAGSRWATINLLAPEDDGLLCGGNPDQPVVLNGADKGSFPSYILRVQFPILGLTRMFAWWPWQGCRPVLMALPAFASSTGSPIATSATRIIS
jgi:hypothetical protein